MPISIFHLVGVAEDRAVVMIKATEDTVQRMLRRAMGQSECWPLFYRVLKSSRVYVLGKFNGHFREHVPLKDGSSLSINTGRKADGSLWVPFFSSEENVYLATKSAWPYFSMPARMLLENTKGANLVLNGSSSCAKEFSPDEVENILQARYNTIPLEETLVEHGEILLGLPEECPSALVDALTTLFSKYPAVKAAYLGATHNIYYDESPTLIIGIELDAPAPELVSTASRVIAENKFQEDSVRLFAFDHHSAKLDPTQNYLITQCEPFYHRSWGSRLRGLIGVGHA